MPVRLLPLNLTVVPDGWRLFTIRKADKKFTAFKNAVLKREQNCCNYCGFCSRYHQEIVNVDGNYQNNRLSNLGVACAFCAQTLFFDRVGKYEPSGGVLIVLPELTQNELNAWCHVLFMAMHSSSNYAGEARNIYYKLKQRSQLLEQVLGNGLSDAALLGEILLRGNLPNFDYFVGEIKDKIRLLPSYSSFGDLLHDWATEVRDDLKME